MGGNFLLLNPPGKKKYLRDYYCSSVAKAAYYWHPGDLLFQSGILDKNFDVHVIDAIAENLTTEKCREKIRALSPEYIYFLTSAASWKEDMEFVAGLGVKNVFASGEIFLDDGANWLEKFDFLTGILTDFSTEDLVNFIAQDYAKIESMIYRRGKQVVRAKKKKSRVFSVPIPMHEKFIGDYRMPFSKHEKFASLLTDHGCPHCCEFCNSWIQGYRVRTKEDIAAEIDYISHLGIKQIFLKDMSFGGDKSHAQMVLALLKPFEFDWHCYAKAEDLSFDLLKAMKESGCYMISLGLEHVDEKILSAGNKKTDMAKRNLILAHCRSLGILIGAHFILGLPGENHNSLAKLERAIANMDVDYISLNIAAPRFGSRLRRQLCKNGHKMPMTHEVSFSEPAIKTEVPPSILIETQKRILRRFYGRLGYIAQNAFKAVTWRSLMEGGANGFALFKSICKGREV